MADKHRLHERLEEAFADSALFDPEYTIDDVEKWIDTICDSRLHDKTHADLLFSSIPSPVVAMLLHTLLAELDT